VLLGHETAVLDVEQAVKIGEFPGTAVEAGRRRRWDCSVRGPDLQSAHGLWNGCPRSVTLV
jgi:hypothetical protein